MTLIAGRYTLEAEIGRGGMGAVWRGRDEVLGRTVALKKIGAAPGGITPDARRAEREAKLAAKLNHANVVAVFDLVEEASAGESQQWLVMEYVEGTDLAVLIRQRGRLTPDEAAPILAQAASALAAAHGVGIVHRDVKPSNILVSPDGQVKLNDFGIARTASDPSLTQTGLVTGSPAYLSPEVASGQPATPASDAWSWGATLFHALEGRPPYDVGDNVLGALYRIVHEEPPRSAAAGWLAPALESTMVREPAQRWPMTTAERFLVARPETQPVSVSAPVAQRGSGGATPPSPRSSVPEDASTRVLPLGAMPTAPPPPPGPVTTPQGDEPTGSRWPVLIGAALAVAIAMTVAFYLGLRDHGDGSDGSDDSAGGRSGGTAGASPSAGGDSGTPSPSAAADQPTEKGMVDFVEGYLQTAAEDPESAFDMLTPAFQAHSGGMQGYLGFWGDVRNAKVLDISADPDQLEVSYTYRYTKPHEGSTEDHVVLKLTYEKGTYLIAEEL